jgi:hypothetical protein
VSLSSPTTDDRRLLPAPLIPLISRAKSRRLAGVSEATAERETAAETLTRSSAKRKGPLIPLISRG